MNTSAALEGLYDYFDNLAEGIAVLDLQGHIVSMNQTAARILGLQRGVPAQGKFEEIADAFTPAGERIPSQDRPSRLALRGQFVRNYEAALWPKGADAPTLVEISTAPIAGPDGATAQVILSYRDITERKRVDEARARLAAIVESSEDAIIGKDLNGIVTAWNRGAQKLFGYTAEEMVGCSIRILLLPGQEAVEDEILQRIARGEVVQHAEVSRRKKNGEIVQVSMKISPIRNDKGEVIGASKIARDITESIRTADAVRESQQRLSGILDSAMDAIITVDEQQRIVLFNAAAERMFLCPQSSALGQKIDRFIPERFRPSHARHIHTFSETGMTSRAMGELGSLWALRTNGEEFQIEASISQIEARGRKLFTVILRDITDRQHAEDALRESQQRLSCILDSAMDAIITVDEQQCIVLFNAAAERMFLCPQSSALGQKIDRFIPKRFRPSHARHIRNFGETGMTSRAMGELGSLWALRTNGEEFQIEASISHIESRGRKLFTVILRDITDRMRADESLREQAQLLNASQTIARDMENHIVFWSDGAEKMYGYSRQEALGTVANELFHTQFPEPLERIEEQLLSTGQWNGELVHKRRDGETIIVSSAWTLHRDSAGIPIRILESLIDITERKRAEEKLRAQSEELARSQRSLEEKTLLLQSVLDGMCEGLVAVDGNGEFVLWNPTAEKIVGLGPSKVPAEGWTDNYGLFLPDGITPLPSEENPLAIAITGRINTAVLFARNKEIPDGAFLEVFASPIKNKDGVAHGAVTAFRDITERKRAEEAVRKQAEELARSQRALEEKTLMLQSVLDSMIEGLVAVDEEGHFVLWNPAAEKIVGLGPADVPPGEWNEHYGVFLADAVTPLPAEQNPLMIAIKGQPNSAVIFLRNEKIPEGAFLEAFSSPIKDKEGVTRGAVTAFRDMTERKRAEEKLRQSEERFATAFQSSPLATTLSTATDGRIIDANGTFLKMLGYKAEEAVGRTDVELGIWPIPEQRAELFEKLRQNGRVGSFEAQFRTKSGDSRMVNLSLEPIVLDGVECVLTTGSDVTETKNLERQLHQSLKMEALGQLTGGIAHDFNNLLGVVVGNLDLLERQVAWNEAAVKRVQAAQRAAIRGAELTRRLLAFSRKEQLNPAPVVMSDAIHEVVELASRAIGPETKISTQCDANLPPVFVDAAGLETALLNLALNARDAMPKGGSLVLRAHLADLTGANALVRAEELKPGKYARITVSDSGSGMPREVLDRAFEPFFTTKPREKGTGLGLAMVYGFIKQSGGAIRLYSEVGFGTTVSLYLPLATDTDVVEDIPEPEPAKAPERVGGTALLVDDEADLLDVADAYLAELGYTVIRAQDGAEALEALDRAGHVDLLVTDIIMPGKMSGIELAQKVRELRPGIKVIFTSGFPAEALAERSGKLEGGPLLHKPYQRAEFADIVRKQVRADLR